TTLGVFDTRHRKRLNDEVQALAPKFPVEGLVNFELGALYRAGTYCDVVALCQSLEELGEFLNRSGKVGVGEDDVVTSGSVDSLLDGIALARVPAVTYQPYRTGA